MAPIGMEKKRYRAKKSGMAAVALFVALAAVPVLAETAQEQVINRLSCQTSTAAMNQTSDGKGINPSGGAASLQMRQQQEQGSYQERYIRIISGETSAGVSRETWQGKEATPSGTPASLQMRHELGQSDYQEMYIHRVAGETLPKAGAKY